MSSSVSRTILVLVQLLLLAEFLVFDPPSAVAGALSAPSSLRATAVTISQINLTWTDTSTAESQFRVERAPLSTGPWVEIGSTGANVASYSDTGLASSTTYYYRVRVYGIKNGLPYYSTYTSVAKATTLKDSTPPTVSTPTTASTWTTSSSTINLGGTASDNVGVTSVTGSNAANGWSGPASGTTSWSVSSVPLQAGTNVITVTAKDAANNAGTKTLTVTYTPADTTAPTVSISSPTTASTWTTSSSTISL